MASSSVVSPKGGPIAGTPGHGAAAAFALRCATANVCIFPLATRNKHAVVQFAVGLVTTMVALTWLLARSTGLPLLLILAAVPFLSLPALTFVIPLQAALVVACTRGRWHDHKSARLDLLLRRLDEFDCLAVQELFSGLFDARYRDRVVATAKAAGMHYAVVTPRLPVLPAFLLNTGTLLLSRYPILHSGVRVFRTRAFYDYFIVNRGASWMRVELPGTPAGGSAGATAHKQQVDIFTVHLAPPLLEVSGRAGKLLEYCTCVQEAQLDELVDWMRECLQVGRGPPGGRSAPPPNVVLMGDFNIDCGSLRYFGLLHRLQSLSDGVRMVDLFATKEEAQAYDQLATRGEVPESDAEEEQEEETADTVPMAHTDSESTQEDDLGEAGSHGAGGARGASTAPAIRRRHPRTAAFPCRSRSSSLASLPPPFSASPLSPRLLEAASSPAAAASASGSSSSSSSSGVGPVSPPASAYTIAWNEWHVSRGNGREAYDPEAHAPFRSVMGPQRLKWESTFGQVVTTRLPSHQQRASRLHLETFLTHETLLGSHSTHDYLFSNCRPLTQRVEPFLTEHAKAAMARAALGYTDDRHEETPPFTQLSDHCALVATLICPTRTETQTATEI